METSHQAVTEHIAAALEDLADNIDDVEFLGEALVKLERYRRAHQGHLEQHDRQLHHLTEFAANLYARVEKLEAAQEVAAPPKDHERSEPCAHPNPTPPSP